MTAASQRIDKWLWFTRQFKTRTLAAKMVTSGKIRVNNQRINKSSLSLQIGDTITFFAYERIKILKVLDAGTHRGPASEAAALYEDLSPSPESRKEADKKALNAGVREDGAGRPTKKQRREIDALMDRGA